MKNHNHTPLIGLAALMRMAVADDDLTALGTQLITRATLDAEDANALLDLSTLLQLRGQQSVALATQVQALQIRQLYRAPTAAGPACLRVLAVMAPGDLMANTPLECLLEQANVQLDLLYVSADLPLPPTLPAHDALFIAVGESEQNQPLLQQLATTVAAWPCPVINRPAGIARLSRNDAYERLHAIPGVVMPVTLRLDKNTLQQIGQQALPLTAALPHADFPEALVIQEALSIPTTVGGFQEALVSPLRGGCPIIVRPVDSHAGHGLAKLDHPDGIAEYLREHGDAALPVAFYLSPFIDYRSADGWFRKYRVLLINGRPFACHMAISKHWMIHYLNADMTGNAANRAEEANFMANFDEGFALRHKNALRAIYESVGLHYFGIDCAETADGKLLIFEVDSNMIVHAMDPPELFPYKQPQMRKVFDAFCQMLNDETAQTPPAA
ncbi:MAG: RimK family alpha-L-glutamate ligase [Methylococcaceae bacterium]|nr:MAG: RimK family alpha-L-glutamate ligase [Methylococcaceae bacterium]